jgi:hypothetical protein
LERITTRRLDAIRRRQRLMAYHQGPFGEEMRVFVQWERRETVEESMGSYTEIVPKLVGGC